jgi:hypothetical protein
MFEVSGARMAVLKTAPPGKARDRLHAQAAWLKTFDDPHIVKVLEEREDGYVMPYLQTPEWPLKNPLVMMDAVLSILSTSVWVRPAPVPLDYSTFVTYLESLRQPLLTAYWWEIIEQGSNAVWDYTHDIHGDPTLENLLFACDGTPVLVDPIPDAVLDGKIPPVRAVDLGKCLQSCLGYELVKRGLQTKWLGDQKLSNIIKPYARSEAEWEFSKFFCAVHVARFIPYQTEYFHQQWTSWFPEIVETLKWL